MDQCEACENKPNGYASREIGNRCTTPVDTVLSAYLSKFATSVGHARIIAR
jgi:hypothetical protein